MSLITLLRARSSLATFALALVCGAAASTWIISSYRYADWVFVGRVHSEASALALVLFPVLSTLMFRPYLRSDLLWFLPSTQRGGRIAQRYVIVGALSGVSGYTVGVLPGWVWAIRTSGTTDGIGQAIAGYAVGALAVAASVFVGSICYMLVRSIWLGVLVAVLLAAMAYLAFQSDAAYGDFRTHWPMLPFDGNGIYFGSGFVQVRWPLIAIRIVGALLVIVAAAHLVPRLPARWGGLSLRLKACATPLVGAAIAVFLGTSVVSLPVTSARNQDQVCQNGYVTVCVVRSHQHDLQQIAQAATSVTRSAGPALLPARRVIESTVQPSTQALTTISISPERGISPRDDIAGQVSTAAAHLEKCLSGRTPDNYDAATTVADWLASQAGSSRVTNPSSKGLIERWNKNPHQVNRQLSGMAQKISSCHLTSADLPK